MGWFKKLSFVFVILVILVVAIAVFSYFRPKVVTDLILGNDLTISLSAGNKNLDLINGDSGKINFDFSVVASAFCDVKCDSQVVDLGKNVIMEKESFDIRPLISKNYELDLLADQSGVGKSFYRFEVVCKNQESYLCRGRGMTRTRSLLIVVNHNLSKSEEQENIILQQRATNILKNLHQINLTASEINYVSEKYNFNEFKNETKDIMKSAEAYISLSSAFNDLWKEQKYNLLSDEVVRVEKDVTNLQAQLDDVKDRFDSRIIANNNFVDMMGKIRIKLDSINLGSANATEFVIRYNKLVENNISSIENKIVLATSLYSDVSSADLSNSYSNISVSVKVLNKVVFSYSSFNNSLISLDLDGPMLKCCLFGQCLSCCEQCSSDESLYPVLLLHGHDFNRDASAEYALDMMGDLQNKLESDGFLNAGSLLVSGDDSGVGSLTAPWPVSVKSSYYFDIYQSKGVIETKTDNVDTYAIRLRDIIDVTKKKTNKDKVNIVAHSMGGLVVRRYLQIFGSDSINKVILIAVPNHGINGDTLRYCYLFGERQECSDMDSSSLLIGKLNNAARSIKIYNIYGDGCVMGDSTGDGIVKKDSAYLDNAENIVVNGSCDGNFNYLHLDIINFNKHPEVYDYIVNYLKSQ